MIPYVISEAYPDYKRPGLRQCFGVIKEEEMAAYFLEKVCEFILDSINIDNLQCLNDIKNFWNNYYNECYMENLPWNVMVFINGEWENAVPSNEQIWEHIRLYKIQEEQDDDDDEEETEDEE